MCDRCGCDEAARVDGHAVHAHGHADGHGHDHGHDHEHDHDHDHGHDHDHDHDHEHEHEHDHGHGHGHEHGHGRGRGDGEVPVPILSANDRVAARTRRRLADAGVLCLNLVGTPGAGKTTLVERTLPLLAARGLRAAVIVGDLATQNDAERLRRAGGAVVGIETGVACHLGAPIIEQAIDRLPVPLEDLDVLLIENVGNLVCPALFDLGEAAKVALVSVTEGDDKPQKYPVLVANAELFLITKTDLLPYVRFDLEVCREHARRVHPGIEALSVSSTSGEGVETWLDWIGARRAPQGAASASA